MGLTSTKEMWSYTEADPGERPEDPPYFWGKRKHFLWRTPPPPLSRGQGPVSRKSRLLFGPEIKYSNQNTKNKSAATG